MESILTHPCTPNSEQEVHQNCPRKIWGTAETQRPYFHQVDLENTAHGEIEPELVKQLCVCAQACTHGHGCPEDLISSLGSKFPKRLFTWNLNF